MKKASSPPKLYKTSYFEQKIVRNSTLNFVLIRTILPRMQEKKTEKEISGKEKKGCTEKATGKMRKEEPGKVEKAAPC